MAETGDRERAGGCTVLFSGGSDSTLVAALALETHSRIELLTCSRSWMFFIENSANTARRLEQTYGEDRISQRFFDINEPFRALFQGNKSADLRRYQTHLSLLVCLACKMSMHGAAIVHNLQNGLKHTVDGARRETDWFPAQMAVVKERMQELHRGYGLTLDSPVYDMEATDEELHRMGLTEDKRLKGQFLLHDTQPSCAFGSVAHVYSRLFYGPFFGSDTREADALEYFGAKLPTLESWIDRRLEE